MKMDSTFYRCYAKPSQPYEGTRHIPLEAKSSSPKVVSIPVHFVVSEESRSTAAQGIQKVFRGFLVRKKVKKIASIKREVDEIEMKISLKETADLIRQDSKERLKMNEMLMALLFRLDSVRRVDPAVRDFRKSVIKKAIMLQEKLDAIASGESGDQQVEPVDQIEGRLVDSEFNSGQEDSKSLEKFEENVENAEEDVNTEGLKESPGENQSSVEEEADGMQIDQADPIQGSIGTDAGREVEGKVEMQDENKVLMERMIEKNEILLGMVADLCEKNKMQTQMINCLSKRMDHLEKAFKSERSRCKKRRQVAGSVDAKKP